MKPVESGFDAMDPANVSPLVVWLGSDEARAVTGRVFEVEGGQLSRRRRLAPRQGPVDKGARWDPAELGPVVEQLIAEAPARGPRLRGRADTASQLPVVGPPTHARSWPLRPASPIERRLPCSPYSG